MGRNHYAKNRFGKKLAYLRKSRGLSQEKLAELANIDVGYLSQIECGRANLTMDRMIELGDALDVDICEIFTFHDKI